MSFHKHSSILLSLIFPFLICTSFPPNSFLFKLHFQNLCANTNRDHSGLFTVLIQWFWFSPNIQFLQNSTVSLECHHEFIQKKIKSQEGKALFRKKLFPPLEGRMQSTSRISLVIFTSRVTFLSNYSYNQFW